MRTKVASAAIVLVLVGGCEGRGAAPLGAGATPSPSPVPTGRPPAAESYDYDAPLPRGPQRFATLLTGVSAELADAVGSWIDQGATPGPPARPVLLRAVHQQRLYRGLAARPRLFERVRPLLPRRLGRVAAQTVRAGSRLRKLITPLDDPPDWTIHRPAPVEELRRYYERGERRFDIPWEILAALNFVESRFGRILGPSSAGAVGPMQFLPSTWDAYGNGGDVNDPRDAILGAARYLAASGAPRRMEDALFAYNRSQNYLRAIVIYARQMMRDERVFYAYYHWQVYVLTKDGDVRMSGPGATG